MNRKTGTAPPVVHTHMSENSELTKNRKGSTFYLIGDPEKHWLSSLPKSHLPLLDLGACYGVQTMHAMKKGRHVIALDCCDEHIRILRERVANMHRTENTGELRNTIVAELPASHALDDESVSGILCSEVIHFMKPADLPPLFHDFYRWIAPGGNLVVTVGAWPPRLKTFIEKGCTLPDGITLDTAYHMLKNSPASELVDAAPGMMTMPLNSSKRATLGDQLYMLSTQELKHVSESSGFVVEQLRYYSPGKYPDASSDDAPETVLLVASKPKLVR